MKDAGYLGPVGTFTEIAARRCLGERYNLVCLTDLSEIVAGVADGSLDKGVVPLENSTEGYVGQVLDLVVQAPDIKFCGEIVLNIEHHLLARPCILKDQITRILSHPQAIAQCRAYIGRLAQRVQTEETASTAMAASMVAASAGPWAAIGTELAAAKYNLEVLDSCIQDSSDNETRFIVMGREDAGYMASSKTSIFFSAEDRPGSLYSILREFTLRDINLTRIESRPLKKKLGQYLFFIDLEGHREDPGVKDALEAIEHRTGLLRVLGSYPAWRPGDLKKNPGGPPGVSKDELRREIDVVDCQLLELLGVRSRLVERIGVLKKENAIRDENREKDVLGKVRLLARRHGVDTFLAEDLYKTMMSHFVKLQAKK